MMLLSVLISLYIIRITISSDGAHWDYEAWDIKQWQKDYPLCAAGDESPINIDTSKAFQTNICTSEFKWDINYDHHTFHVTNNGHSISVEAIHFRDGLDNIKRKYSTETDHIDLQSSHNTVAKFPNYLAPPGADNLEFCLDSFHFHWGQNESFGSEHTFDGKHFPLEAHFVHFSCFYDNISDAVNYYKKNIDSHILGVVSIMYETGPDVEDNPAFDAILNDNILSDIKYPDNPNTTNITGTTFINDLDMTGLIPSHIDTAGYYAYEGSLTTPPCTDVVRWFVMNARGYISRKQLNKFHNLYGPNIAGKEVLIAGNYRPIQSNVNEVDACTETEISDSLLDFDWNSDEILLLGLFALGGAIFAAFLCGIGIYIRHRCFENRFGNRKCSSTDRHNLLETEPLPDDPDLNYDILMDDK